LVGFREKIRWLARELRIADMKNRGGQEMVRQGKQGVVRRSINAKKGLGSDNPEGRIWLAIFRIKVNAVRFFAEF